MKRRDIEKALLVGFSQFTLVGKRFKSVQKHSWTEVDITTIFITYARSLKSIIRHQIPTYFYFALLYNEIE